MPALLASISAPRRQQILKLIWLRELPAGEIAAAIPEVTFGAVSQHLAALRTAGVVTVRAHGKHRFYRAHTQALGPLAAALEKLWFGHLTKLKALAESDQRRINQRRKSSQNN